MLISAKRYIGSTANIKLVAGRVSEIGVPVSRQVRFYSHGSGVLLARTQSNKDGWYKVYLPYDSAYTLISIDSRKLFNAVIQDNVVPK